MKGSASVTWCDTMRAIKLAGSLEESVAACGGVVVSLADFWYCPSSNLAAAFLCIFISRHRFCFLFALLSSCFCSRSFSGGACGRSTACPSRGGATGRVVALGACSCELVRSPNPIYLWGLGRFARREKGASEIDDRMASEIRLPPRFGNWGTCFRNYRCFRN